MKIGNVKLNLDFYHPEKDIYSDGDIENELLEIVEEDREEEVLMNDNRWPILYYFSKIRQNILSWYKFEENANILEIGTGCGAITGLFCERNMNVTGVESSKRRAVITAKRNSDYDKLTINVGDFMDMKFDIKYDYITLIGVLEYARMFMPNSNNPYADMVNKCKSMLKKNGKIFIAIENRLGIKYFAGAAEDHTGKLYDGIENYLNSNRVQTFSKNELNNILLKAGIEKIEWFYPYPDYKLPQQIFSDEFLPSGEMLYQGINSFDTNRIMNFDERKAIQSIADAGEFATFSNSFLVVCQ